MKIKHLCFILCLISSSQLYAEVKSRRPATIPSSPWVWGIGFSATENIYKGFDGRVIPLPLIGYKGEKLSIFGPYVSYKLYNINNIDISLALSPVFEGYDESDSDIFRGMDDRDFSLAAGVDLSYKKDAWRIKISAVHDILSRYDGYQIQPNISRSFRFGPYMIEPSIGVTYFDSHYVDYYYGVQANEAIAERPQFSGEESLSTQLGIALVSYQLFKGMTRIQLRNTFYDDKITDSPLVEEDSSISLLFTYSNTF